MTCNWVADMALRTTLDDKSGTMHKDIQSFLKNKPFPKMNKGNILYIDNAYINFDKKFCSIMIE